MKFGDAVRRTLKLHIWERVGRKWSSRKLMDLFVYDLESDNLSFLSNRQLLKKYTAHFLNPNFRGNIKDWDGTVFTTGS